MSNPNEPWSNPYGQPGQDDPGQYGAQPGGNPQYGNTQPYQSSPGGYPAQPSQAGYPAQPAQGGYPAQPSQAGYPAQAPQAGYGSNPYGQPFPQSPYNTFTNRPSRPGSVIAAAVLSYVQAGFVLIGAIVLFAAADTFNDLGADVGEAVVDGIINIILGALLIAGAVMITGGRNRNVLLLALVANLADCVYWAIRAEDGKALVLLFVFLPVIALGLILTGGVSNWLRAKQSGQTGAPGPAGYGG